MKNFRKLFFLAKIVIEMRISEQIILLREISIQACPHAFRGITGISYTAYSLTVALTKQPFAFPTATFPQPTVAFLKATAQPNRA